uniref:Arf-GAP domain-containing protein n=1 Tax=Trichuris muris TaxID=70415 RepID=A0A5S6R352_TRIMR
MDNRSKERLAPHGGTKMATVKKKQDDRNLKILREQAALACNKQCFDCYQRGPTYIDMTIGSFVCTSCSGLLRGLNPPHRVKSISMATFTADEIEFVKSRGNEYCRNVWMGRYDKGRGLDESSFKDETQMKDFLVLKYEKKRWYVTPTESMNLKTSSSGSPSSTLDGQSVEAPTAPAYPAQFRSRPSQQPVVKSLFDSQNTKQSLLNVDFDPFNMLNVEGPKDKPLEVNTSSFADFANFESQNASLSFGVAQAPTPVIAEPVEQGTISSSSAVPIDGASCPSADKYSALAELDELFRNDPSNAMSVGSLGAQSLSVQTTSAPVQSSFSSIGAAHGSVPNPFGVTGATPPTVGLMSAGSFNSNGILAGSTSPSWNPFFTVNVANDQKQPFASLNPFGTQASVSASYANFQLPNKAINGAANVPSPTGGTFHDAAKQQQSNWNPFL